MKKLKKKNIVEVNDFSQKEWKWLIKEALAFHKNKYRKPKILKDKQIGLLFDSNSLRTRISFDTAINLLGGDSYFIDIRKLIHEDDGTKRETFEDIIDTADRMIDAYVLRDYSQKMLEVFKRKNDPPFINGFCQVGHPSQALADMGAISLHKKTIDGLTYAGVCPSTGSGVIESFVYAVLLLGQHITLITETGSFTGKNPDFDVQVKKLIKQYGGSLSVTVNKKDILHKADVLYVDEWWENSPDYLNKDIGKYRVDNTFLKGSKKELVILHCMPAHPGREITEEVMRGPKSIIYDEAEFRVYSAMALLSYLATK